jgi:hypothetical protein
MRRARVFVLSSLLSCGLLAGRSPAVVTVFSHEAGYLSACTSNGFDHAPEGLEDGAVWGSVRTITDGFAGT